jgi:hypothetical protein
LAINFNTVAAEGHVSKDFLYNNPLLRREIITRRSPTQGTPYAGSKSPSASGASARVKLQVASAALRAMREENLALRAENALLHGDLLTARRLSTGTRSQGDPLS